jgi:V/A-type H+/Na+-transporting ATPase subunit C
MSAEQRTPRRDANRTAHILGVTKIRLESYPYTYARVCSMRSGLLRKADYDKLMKMTVNEIIGFLQETPYKKEINALAQKYSGLKLIETALNRNIEEIFGKMRRISIKPELLRIVDAYLLRFDVRNIKTILRAKYTHSESESEDLLVAGGSLKRDFLLRLLEKPNIEEILKVNGLISIETLWQPFKTFQETNVLGEVETVFDIYYFSYLFKLAAMIPRQGSLFKEFLQRELEVTNIINVMRLKRAGLDERTSGKYLVPTGADFMGRLSELMTSDAARAPEIFKGTEYEKLLEDYLKKRKDDSVIELETALKSHLLNKTTLLSHQHPLSVDVIIGYIFAKDMEARNLKVMLRGKQLGLEDSFIESQLVI